MVQAQVRAGSLLEERLSDYQPELLPGSGDFEAFLKQRGELRVTPSIARKFPDKVVSTSCSVLLDGNRIGYFVRVHNHGALRMVRYCGIIPGVVNEKIRLSYYLHGWNASSTGFYQFNGFLVPFPGRTAEK